MTLYLILCASGRGEPSAACLGVHSSLETAKAALLAWGNANYAPEYVAEFLCDDGEAFYSESEIIDIVTKELLH